jgi:hypothetical protein
MSLGDEPSRSASQEVECREDDVKDDRTYGETAKQCRVAQSTNYRRVDEAEKRRCQIGKRHRQGDRQDAAICHLKRADFSFDFSHRARLAIDRLPNGSKGVGVDY